MAKMTIKAGEEWALKLGKVGDASREICNKAVKAAAGILADEIRANINALPEDSYRHLRDGDMFTGLPPSQKEDLLDSLGVTPVLQDRAGWINAKVGFDGYGKYKTKKYPKGIPNPMLAASVERGSSVREATPFVKPAIKSKKKECENEMQKIIDEEIEKVMKG